MHSLGRAILVLLTEPCLLVYPPTGKKYSMNDLILFNQCTSTQLILPLLATSPSSKKKSLLISKFPDFLRASLKNQQNFSSNDQLLLITIIHYSIWILELDQICCITSISLHCVIDLPSLSPTKGAAHLIAKLISFYVQNLNFIIKTDIMRGEITVLFSLFETF